MSFNNFDLTPPVLKVITAENVTLNLPIASVIQRAGAYFIDVILQIVAATMFITLITSLVGEGLIIPEYLPIAGIIGWLLIHDGYFILFETFMRGQTPGKKLTGIRVVRDNGGAITFREALIRQIFRYIDFLPALYSIGTASMMLGSYQQRMGDRVAHTVVIRESKKSPPLSQLTFVIPEFLTAEERWLIREFLHRRQTLQPYIKREIARRIINYLHRQYPSFFPPPPEGYLDLTSFLVEQLQKITPGNEA